MEEIDLNKKTDSLLKGLLDTGKRTNLINYKDGKSSNVEILHPSIHDLFKLVINNNDLVINNYTNELKKALVEDNTPSAAKNFMKEKIGSCKRNEILICNPKVSNPYDVLTKLIKNNKSSLDETGVNLCYMALGFLKWSDNETTNYPLYSPLLLVPISIKQADNKKEYNLSFLSDDIITNDSLLLKFKSDFNINLPKFSLDKYTDLVNYFEEIEDIVKTYDFKVVEDVRIGLFSFSNINIYNDIVENKDELLSNDNVRLLLGDTSNEPNFNFETEDIKEVKDEFLTLHNVVDADSSQMVAILNAKEGNTFVLQGPPGTGKSQTITNIIAESLYDGKTVLFVSEKQAALNVVFDKLKNIGLEDSCLELHSEKSKKKEVIAELARTLSLDSIDYVSQANEYLKDRDELSNSLDIYSDELHKLDPRVNMSLYDLYNNLYRYNEAQEMNYIIPDITSKDSDYLNKVSQVLEYYINYSKTIGDDYHKNIWYGFNKETATRTDLIELSDILKTTNIYLEKLNKISDEISKTFNFGVRSVSEVEKISKTLDTISNSSMLGPEIFSRLNDESFNKLLSDTVDMCETYKNEKETIENGFDKDIYKLDGRKLFKKISIQYRSVFSRIFNKDYKNILNELRLTTNDGHKIKYKEAYEILNSLANFQEAEENFKNNEEQYKSLFKFNYNGIYSNFKELNEEVLVLKGLCLSNEELKSISSLDDTKYLEGKEKASNISEELRDNEDTFKVTKDNLISHINKELFNFDTYELKVLTDKFETLYQNVETYPHWAKFLTLYRELECMSLVDYIDFSIEQNLEPEYLVTSYKRIYFHEWIDELLKECPMLNKLPRNMHDEIIKKFQEADRLSLEINKAKIRSKLSSERPNLKMVSKGSAISRILRENEKKSRKMPIKELFATVPELILMLKPCLLMSPLSVSTYLPADLKFDLIIFDEASQILPGHALGSLYRGQQHIIVGDSKQMPPTVFFSSTFSEEVEEVSDTVNDYESILDLATAVYPGISLKWHYRSHYEQLIAFSNKNFYSNSLISFPSTLTDRDGIGVDFEYVENGVFDRKHKFNSREAQRIIDLVSDYVKKYPNRSIGIVAFSKSQQELIEQLLEQRSIEDKVLENYRLEHKKEPMFVKNLETVQGDERDTIIFSIGYGPDSEGRILMNFGPINRDGGERRLNVAFTRARDHVLLVSSLKYSDIDLKRTKAKGSALLREYLDFAENGEKALERNLSVNQVNEFDSPFELDVYDFLVENGFSVDTQVGCSSYRIDMCIKRPGTSDYVLAIECDGASYHSSYCARDRDRLRQSVLENMGWNFYRIWSTDWFYDNKVEKAKLLDAVSKALNKKEGIDSKQNDTSNNKDMDLSNVFEKKIEVKEFEFDKYELFDESNFRQPRYQYSDETLVLNRPVIYRNLSKVIQKEGPINKKWLFKRYSYMFNRQCASKFVTEVFDNMVRAYRNSDSMPTIIEKDGYLFYEEITYPELRVNTEANERDAKYICDQELASGMLKIIELNKWISKEGLYKELANRIGRRSVTQYLRKKFDNAFILLEGSIKITEDNMIVLAD